MGRASRVNCLGVAINVAGNLSSVRFPLVSRSTPGGRKQARESRKKVFGEVVERLMALGCKPSVLRDYEGSNPSLSTINSFSERE